LRKMGGGKLGITRRGKKNYASRKEKRLPNEKGKGGKGLSKKEKGRKKTCCSARRKKRGS